MRLRTSLLCLAAASMTAGEAVGAEVPPGRQHRLSIEGETAVTFLPQANLPPIKTEYKALVEYIVDTRRLKPPTKKADAPDVGQKAKAPAKVAAAAVDLSLHSSEFAYRQEGQPPVESKVSRSRFQGRLQPNAPVVDVAAKQAPAALMDVLKRYDTVVATMLVDAENKVIDLKIKDLAHQKPIVQTLVSIHAPMPEGVDTWEAPSRLAMGQGQTAKGKLRFTKLKPEVAAVEGKPGRRKPVKVKVTGVLKGEGVVVGSLIKDGSYTVEGEQTYDPEAREWVASRWSVQVDNELANQAGLTLARAKGTMVVQSAAVADGAATDAPVSPRAARGASARAAK